MPEDGKNNIRFALLDRVEPAEIEAFRPWFFASPDWLGVVQRGTGLKTGYLFAEVNGEKMCSAAALDAAAPQDSRNLYSVYDGTYGGVLTRGDAGSRSKVGFWQLVLERYPRLSVHVYCHPRFQPDSMPSDFTPEEQYTQYLDLAGGYETVWDAGIHSKKRNQIRKSKKAGYAVRFGESVSDFSAYHKLYAESTRLWGMGEPNYTRRFFEAMAELPPEKCRLWMCMKGERPVAGALVFYDHLEAFYFSACYEREEGPNCPGDFLLDRIIADACERGLKFLNLGSSGPLEGVRHYKESFGGKVFPYKTYKRLSGDGGRAAVGGGIRRFVPTPRRMKRVLGAMGELLAARRILKSVSEHERKRERSKQPKLICLLATGTSVHITKWSEYLRDRGYEVHLVSDSPVDVRGVEYHHFSFNIPFFSRMSLLVKENAGQFRAQAERLSEIVSEVRADVWHSHYVQNFSIWARLAGLKPHIVTVWGGDVLQEQMEINSPDTRPPFWFSAQTRKTLQMADAVTADAKFIIDELENRWGVARSNVLLCPWGVDMKESAREPAFNGNPVVYSNRRYDNVYNIDVVVRAIPGVIERFPDAKFVFTNKGPREDGIRSLVAELGLERHVEFMGFVPDVSDALSKSWVYVSVPDSDGTSMSLLEALVAGLPVVVSDIPANHEWVRDMENGIIVKPRDHAALSGAICRLLEDENLRRKMSAQNRRFSAAKIDRSVVMREIEKLYERVVQRRAGTC